MPFASGPATDSHALPVHASSQSTGSIAVNSLPVFDAQSLIMTLIGMAGTLFLFAAWNTLNRAATEKVRKR
jgi:hypothetical protein